MATQGNLFEFEVVDPPGNSPPAGDPQLARVSSRIGAAIVRFCQLRFTVGNAQFHAGELHAEVTRATGLNAPASADRILRDLRSRKVLDYIVLSRRESLYQLTAVPAE